MSLIDEIRIAQRNAGEQVVIRHLESMGLAKNPGEDPYATAEETAALVYQETPDEKWLDEQLDRLYPGRHEMGSIGDVDALSMLVFELREMLLQKVLS